MNTDEDLLLDVVEKTPGAKDFRNEYVKPVRWLKPGVLVTGKPTSYAWEMGIRSMSASRSLMPTSPKPNPSS